MFFAFIPSLERERNWDNSVEGFLVNRTESMLLANFSESSFHTHLNNICVAIF